MKGSFRLGRIAGIEVRLHYTWLFAFALITWSLAEGFFPDQYPGWRPSAYWGTAVLAALLLFGSVLVHELAHSLVALAKALPVRSITLFILGGVSSLGAEATKAKDEFQIAVVGPLTSLALAGIFWLLLRALDERSGPLAAILTYLAVVNALLGGFNLLPGFPLDGGRVLRSIIWRASGSLRKATNVATILGQLLGWALVGYGLFQVFGGNFLSGVWTAFIGWFLNGAADAQRRESVLEEGLQDISVRQAMDPSPLTIGPDASVEELVQTKFLQQGRRAVPVCEGARLVGIVTLSNVKRLGQERWHHARVAEVMTRAPLHQVGPDSTLSDAMRVLAQRDVNQVVVVQDSALVGLLSRADMLRHLQLRQELGLVTGAKSR